MKLLVCGSRNVDDYGLIRANLDKIQPTEIIHGGAFGADSLAHRWATENKIPVTVIKPDWDTHGKAAGPIRNRQMVDICDEVLAFWDGTSRGTKSTIDYTKSVNKPLKVNLTKVRPL